MNRLFLFLVLVCGTVSFSRAEIPVQIRSNETNALTKSLIAALTFLINEHSAYHVTGDTSELHVVLNVTAISDGEAIVLGAVMELHPPGGSLGVGVRSHLVLTNGEESPAMVGVLFQKLLIEDKMVNKLLYMRSVPLNPEDLNELGRLMRAAKSAAERGRI